MSEQSQYQYDVALSFAGEDRELAASLARLLRSKGIRVFYDQYERADLWGKDLYQHFQEVFRDKAQYCVIFISQAYEKKLWPRHELKQAQARAFMVRQEYILPLRVDDTEIPGLNPTIGYVDLRHTSMEDASVLIAQKLLNVLDYDTWHDTPTNLDDFSPKLKSAVDQVLSCAYSAVQSLFERDYSFFEAPVQKVHARLCGLPAKKGLDIEVTCLNYSGRYVYHPRPSIVGKSLASLWVHREGFAEWVLRRIQEMGGGYLTWRDHCASDPNLDKELLLQPRKYERRTLMKFRAVAVSDSILWIVCAEGHEVASIGPATNFQQ
jgi:hypothetical protein